MFHCVPHQLIFYVTLSFSLFLDCCDKYKKVTDLQMVKPTASSGSSLEGTERPASTQKTAASTTNYYITYKAPFTQTESRPEVSSGYITSADAPEFDPTIDPFLTTDKEPLVSSTAATTTTASKVIRGRIPWNRLFGSRERERIMGRLRKPFITPKTTTTTTTETTTTLTTTPAAVPTTTANSVAEPETLSPSRHTGNKEDSINDDYGDLSSADFEFTTSGPSTYHLTTTSSSYYSRSTTTTETLPESQALPSPSTVKPPTVENPDEAISSGSGGLPDNWLVVRQRPGGTRGRQGRRRRPFMGRRPFKRPGITKLPPSTTTETLTTEVTTMETAMETTTLPQHTVSFYKPLYTPSRKEDRTVITVSTDETSKEEEDLYEESEWSTLSSVLTYTTTRTSAIPSPTLSPTTTFKPTMTKGPYTTVWTRVHSNVRPPSQRYNGHNTPRPAIRRIRPTVQSSGVRGSAGNGFSFDSMTILRAEQGYTNTRAPYNNIGNPSVLSVNVADFEPTTKVMTSKPRIVGGNAASFTVLSNSDAFLPCEAVGNPQPTITWKRFSSSTGIFIVFYCIFIV